MMIYRKIGLAFIAVLLAVSLGACKKEDEGPAEKLGKEIDKSMEKMGKEIEKAGEKVGQELEKSGEKIKEATKK